MAKIGLPNIDIEFVQKAVSAIDRSERGVLAVCMASDDLKESMGVGGYKVLTKPSDLHGLECSKAEIETLERIFLCPVNKVYLVAVGNASEFSEATAILDKINFNYVCGTTGNMQQQLATYIINKNQKSKGKKQVAVVYAPTVADSKYIIQVKNSKVLLKDNVQWTPMEEYLPRIASVLCNLPMNRSITYYELEELEEVNMEFVTTEQDLDYWVDKGWLILFKDEDVVKVGRGVNSLTTFTSTDSEDMRKIIIVESMNIILEDIYNTFKNYYVGKYKNSYDNQCLFISAVNAYFRALAREEILDPSFDNHAYVDTVLQREAWLSIGKTEATDWDEATVKNMTFKSYVYLSGNIKIMDAVEDLKFSIAMA